jgi:hypothetical protein
VYYRRVRLCRAPSQDYARRPSEYAHRAEERSAAARRSCHKFSPPHRMHRLRSASLGLLASQTSRSSPSTAVGLELAAAAVGTSRAKSSLSTDFLGVPTNHDELQSKRPMSPHLFGVDNR